MGVGHKHTFKDDWLVKALLYYQIIDETLYNELSMRFSGEDYFFDVLIKNNYLQKEDLITFIEEALKIPVVDLDKVKVDTNLMDKIPEEICKKYQIFPFKENEKEVHIAAFNPSNLEAEREIEYLTGKYVKIFFALLEQINKKIKEFYSPDEIIDSLVKKQQASLNVHVAGEDNVEEKGVVKLMNQIFADAVLNDASDIHIEPREKDVVVRLRIDGVMRNDMELPKTLHQQLVSRIKVISDLNIAETRKPQDGKTKIFVDGADIDMRVSILPTSYGEKVVIRLLDKRKAMVSFEQLGIRGVNQELIKKCFSSHQGMVLVTGPTGSGKSTTLYAAINSLKSTATNILTIEDPIEYVFDGINQVQVNEKAGITFASALRSFLRQDPDVILVGEIRDQETAEIAIQAALTGHLVLSTLHTNDTFGTITRLKDMGVDEVKLAEALQGIIAQRLVRRLCTSCKQPVEKEKLDPRLLYTFEQMGYKTPEVYKANGCAACGYTGYKGRIGVYEILLMDRDLKDALYQEASISELRKMARKKGFRNLFEDALSLVAEGITDYREVLRVVQQDLTIESKKTSPTVTPKPQPKPVSTQPAAQPDKEKAEPEKQSQKEKATGVDKPAKPKKKPDAGGYLSEIKKLAEELKKEQTQSKQKPQGKTAAAKPAVRGENVDILVVEDYPVTRLLLKRMLERQKGWKVREAEDGLKGLDAIHKKMPDVILLDLMMPNMDGYEFLKHLRSEPQGADIPVMIITSLNGAENELKGLELGADDFVTKPINMNVLVAKIRRHLHLPVTETAAVVSNEKKAISVSDSANSSKNSTESDKKEKLNLRLS